ncbi:MAG: hypothetical protein GWP91_24780, partial [Rhodobacterales bacterium]|nr:hypothetical protein [Rhodobacterales bacterium]
PVTGGRSTINNNIQAYGLIMGPDDMLWAADEDQVWRVDPVTGDSELIIERGALDRGAPRVIAFNLANDRLYMGTRGGSNGRIYAVDLDASYNPIGSPFEFAENVGTGNSAGDYHDTMGVDICGNLYVADFWSSSLNRIDTAGNVTELADWPFNMRSMAYGHGMTWGTGIDAWSDFAIYMPQPYLDYNVIEIDLGVPSREWTGGYAINIP